jgi:hypothetical protein
MREFLKWLVEAEGRALNPIGYLAGWSRTQRSIAVDAPAIGTAEPKVPRTAGAAALDNRSSRLVGAILQDVTHRRERRYHYRAKPVGFKGADVLFDAATKFHRGTRVVRSDGRVYEIFHVKKTKKRLA